MCAGLAALGAGTAQAEPRPCAWPEPRESAGQAKSQLGLPSSARGGWLVGPGFGYGIAAPAAAALACAAPNLARAALKEVVLGAESSLGTDAEIAIVLTTHPLACSNIYYVPLANDVRGIGYRHADPREVFDDTPGRRLEGIAFLNDWPYWQPRLDELESAFNHELGHRWGARVHARIAGVDSNALLGREQDHWSYFLDSGGSPLEGNVWRATDSGRSSDTPRYPTRFSPLDRYLMGVLPAAEVPPFELLIQPEGKGRDCRGGALGPASPPQTCGSVELEAEAVRVSIDDVIAAEGPRLPAADDAPRRVDVLVLMLASDDATWSASDCELMARSMRESIEAFERASSGRVRLDNVLTKYFDAGPGDRISCDELRRASSAAAVAGGGAPPASGARSSCALSERAPRVAGGGAGEWLVVLSFAIGRRVAAQNRRTIVEGAASDA